ncbi:hypothetical protein BXT86_03455 [candidate division WOR-3 bacterium 4484_100]|uniref:Uncharacterized protein n=1 Tax=candidate division WOR-3 bacterium 4484_100 TaxID=1936077 RepID=A0A1V4QF76_UNCW3|nr:MAG: hypothetical protein BXT86_03455 [candidate division WOR-3 bacterium 4484_100]
MKYGYKLFFVIMTLLLVLGCEQRGGTNPGIQTKGVRDLSKPSSRLVGHWRNDAGDNLYYDMVNPETQVGSFYIVRPDSSVAKHRYKILSEIPKGERIIVLILFNDGTRRKEIYYINRDGLSMKTETRISDIFISGECKYIDNKTAPEKM